MSPIAVTSPNEPLRNLKQCAAAATPGLSTETCDALSFQGRVRAMIFGGAFGDALGAVIEKMTHQEIKDMYGKVTHLDVPWWRETQDAVRRKGRVRGRGIITDDTLMTICLMSVYCTEERHLDAWDVARGIIREVVWTPRYIPEMQRETMLQERLWYAEKWLFMRHQMTNCDPRQGGIGNQVNCGAAMYIAPIGAVNAGNPRAAYSEAIHFASAHQESYGLEAAGVLAAAVAAAFVPGTTVDDIVEVAIAVAHDGTKAAIVAIVEAARAMIGAPYDDVVVKFHEVIAKYSYTGDDIDYTIDKAGVPSQAYRPSRFNSIEELPLAFGFAITNKGEFYGSIIDGVNSGRDTDSIGVMIGCFLGPLHGASVIEKQHLDMLNSANHFDLLSNADAFGKVARKIQAEDEEEIHKVLQARKQLA
ncbi:ADP-ribosylation/Crystallin J1 [Dioszegia hungarica]|uniref:ADP-ribosylation/Crystallin J1 n=1 Tax=Dioszegia hungarica TaxID=4972 RepID=A0AA38LTL2_9TREE|nr:ADP-ribosylation/Crystallin J1 [Dioszegia hungarica]KAI9633554.1 ADP-ribosylation/Crystallin J1 [Dioszegia hungarica]